MSKRLAIFVSTNNNYFAGCCVALTSFFKNNAWFKGDVIVLVDDLKPEYCDLLTQTFPRLIITQPAPELVAQASVLSEKITRLKTRAKIFYNFHVFTLRGYSRVLKIDADMLFRGPVRSLFELDSTISACSAWPAFAGKSRSKLDYSLVDKGEPDAFSNWINAGLYSVSESALTDDIFESLLAFMSVDFLKGQVSNHTDQLGINTFFQEKIELLPATYNYLLPYEDAIVETGGICAEEALVWHFIGNQKPWNLTINSESSVSPSTSLKVQKEWFSFFVSYNERVVREKHLRKAHKKLKQKIAFKSS